MNHTKELLHDVAEARRNYVVAIANFSEKQALWKPSPDSWNAIEITEHLFWAEQGGILGMWKTLLGIRAGTLNYEADRPHDGLTIDGIIRRTWQEKEIVPAIAAPRMGEPLVAHPHPISGPMSFGQRFEFLRFHIDRHQGQVNKLTVAG